MFWDGLVFAIFHISAEELEIDRAQTDAIILLIATADC